MRAVDRHDPKSMQEFLCEQRSETDFGKRH
jgi:hypothetical protein